MSKSFSIDEYKFEGTNNYPKVVGIINLMLFFILMVAGFDYILHHTYTWFSLFSGVIFLFISRAYDWRSSTRNGLIIICYGLTVVLEFSLFGIPGSPLPFGSDLSKGLVFDLVIGLLPHVYAGLRTMSIFCLVPVWWYSRKLA